MCAPGWALFSRIRTVTAPTPPDSTENGKTMPLFVPPPRKPGPQLTALEATIRAWRRQKWLTGNGHAAQLGMLRHLADQLDRLTEQGKPTAPIARTYWDALASSSPPDAPRADPRAAALTAAAENVLAELEP